ncbi:MAG: glycosyltransferase [Opitutales bacterium]|jgi:glycosyltransferase involved in cell wall biosynthesis|nr:glycosyltransferase [Opitutales bacterium]
MNIEYITNSFTHIGGGLVGAVSGLVQGVAGLGQKVSVSAYDAGGESGDWGDLELRTIHAKRFAGVHFCGDLPVILNEQSPDLVHAHGLWLCSSGQSHRWCQRSGTPYIISPHGMLDPWAVKNSAWKKKIAGHWFEYNHLNGAACLHALCNSEAESIRQFGQENPICVIPNGIDLPGSDESEQPAPWRNDHGRKALLFIGRLHPKKGLPLLLDAWKTLKLSNPELLDEWFLAIAGWSEVGHQADLESQVAGLGIGDDVEFLGALHGEEKHSALCHASGFILPSYSEGLPMSILEAWSYRLPVLMTPECNLPEGFSANAAVGLKTDPKSVEESLRIFFEMKETEQLQMGKCGYELVQQQFTWEQIAVKMVAVYEWILRGGDAPECVQFVK